MFIIGHLRGTGSRPIFPFGGDVAEVDSKQQKINIIGSTLGTDAQGTNSRHWVYSTDGLMSCLDATMYKQPKQIAVPSVKQIGQLVDTDSFGGNPHRGRVYDPEGLAPCLNCNGGGNLEPKIIQRGHGFNSGGEHQIAPTLTSNSYQENNLIKVKEPTSKGYAEATIGDSINLSHPNSTTRRGRVGKKIANTLLTGEEQGVVTPDFRIRKLTPRECWRLQGFPDWAFDRAEKVNSNSQLYKQAGNSVTVNVIAAIAERLN